MLAFPRRRRRGSIEARWASRGRTRRWRGFHGGDAVAQLKLEVVQLGQDQLARFHGGDAVAQFKQRVAGGGPADVAAFPRRRCRGSIEASSGWRRGPTSCGVSTAATPWLN